MSLSKRTLRELRDLVASLPEDVPNVNARRCDALVSALDSQLKPKRSVTRARKVAKAKKQTRKEATAKLRARLMERSGGACEACAVLWGPKAYMVGSAEEMDHFHGGSSRRALESEAGCWMLCGTHHRLKGLNEPGREFWLRLFLKHSETWGYCAEPQRKARADLDTLTLKAQQAHTPGRTT